MLIQRVILNMQKLPETVRIATMLNLIPFNANGIREPIESQNTSQTQTKDQLIGESRAPSTPIHTASKRGENSGGNLY